VYNKIRFGTPNFSGVGVSSHKDIFLKIPKKILTSPQWARNMFILVIIESGLRRRGVRSVSVKNRYVN
jgi:hypothetical protein